MLPAGYCCIPENCLYQPVAVLLTTVHGFTVCFLSTDSHNADLAGRLFLQQQLLDAISESRTPLMRQRSVVLIQYSAMFVP
jgi:hypothetical protein